MHTHMQKPSTDPLAWLPALFTLILIALAFTMFVTSGCGATTAQKDVVWSVVKDASGAVCTIVLQSVVPGAEPLCVALPELLTVIEKLSSAEKAALGLGLGSDAGLPAGAVEQSITNEALYRAVLAHRATASKP